MKIILAGTPQFAANIFQKIIEKFEVVAIITQPNSIRDRGKKLTPSPVKILAQKYNIKCFDPTKIGTLAEILTKIEFDIFLTIAYGQYIPKKIIAIAPEKFINMHGSLLPKYRGAAPIQRAIFNGESESGISLIYMVDKMDAGDIIFAKKITIKKSDNSGSLFKKFEFEIINVIKTWLNKFYLKDFQAIKQDETKVSFAPKLLKEQAYLEKDASIKMINKVRAFNPNPGAYLFIDNKRVKIFKLSYDWIPNSLEIKTEDKNLYATIFQFEGKKIRNVEINNIKK